MCNVTGVVEDKVLRHLATKASGKSITSIAESGEPTVRTNEGLNIMRPKQNVLRVVLESDNFKLLWPRDNFVGKAVLC